MDNLQWNGEAVKAAIRAELAKRLRTAATEVQNEARQLLNVPGTIPIGGGGRNKKGQFRRVYGAAPSLPGEPPRKQRGHLRRSVAIEVDKLSLTARVGTNLKYGRWLELGTSRGLAARPWLRRALSQARQQITAILSRPL